MEFPVEVIYHINKFVKYGKFIKKREKIRNSLRFRQEYIGSCSRYLNRRSVWWYEYNSYKSMIKTTKLHFEDMCRMYVVLYTTESRSSRSLGKRRHKYELHINLDSAIYRLHDIMNNASMQKYRALQFFKLSNKIEHK